MAGELVCSHDVGRANWRRRCRCSIGRVATGGSQNRGLTGAAARLPQVVDTITKKMYECTMDAQEGVVTFLLEEMAAQRVKELLLAYALLLSRGARAWSGPFPRRMRSCMSGVEDVQWFTPPKHAASDVPLCTSAHARA